jgi:hypothetical protein
MVRRRRQRDTPPEDDFDDSFIVSGEETFTINDEEIVVEDALHVVKDGQEYVVIDDTLYPLDAGDDTEDFSEEVCEQPAPSSSGLGTFGMIVLAFVAGFVIFLFAGPLIFGFASGSSDGDNVNVISPDSPKEVSPTPEPTKALSAKSQKAADFKAAMDYSNPITRDYAVSIIPNSHEGKYSIAQICDLWDAVYGRWTYVNDPNGVDYRSPASRTIQLGLKGDCDDFAITVGSLVQSIGGSSRIVTAYNAEGGHAYPEVMVAKDKASFEKIASYIAKRYNAKSIAYHTRTKDGVTQYWLNLDWWSKHPGGKFYDSTGELTFYYPNGYWYQSG